MSSTVVFTLQGPMQSWADRPATAIRPSRHAPTKCGVVGLVANALGRDRRDTIDDLAALRIAIRHDQPGIIEMDYHTIGGGRMPLLPGEVHDDPRLRATANRHGFDAARRGYAAVKAEKLIRGEPAVDLDNTKITRDYYLADAAFTIALTGDPGIVTAITDALTAPARPLFLGRKSHPPATHLAPDIYNAGLLEALAHRPVIGGADHSQCDIDIEDEYGSWIADQPISYHTHQWGKRRHRTIPACAPRPAIGPHVDFFTPQ